MGLHKILKIVGLVLVILAAFFLVRITMEGDDAIKGDGDLQSSLVTPFMYVAFAALAIAIVFVLVFVLKGFAGGNAKNTLVGLGAFLVVIAISYLLASGVETPLKEGKVLSASGSRWVSAGLNAFFILTAVAIGSMIFGGIRKLGKN